MKLEIASIVALVCCLLTVSTSAQVTPTCTQLEEWNLPYFSCQSGDECIFDWYECDSILDCGDFSDEDHCEAEHKDNCIYDFEGKTASDGQALQSFQCGNGMCILGCKRCDGQIDCADATDEIGCSATDQADKPPCA